MEKSRIDKKKEQEGRKLSVRQKNKSKYLPTTLSFFGVKLV